MNLGVIFLTGLTTGGLTCLAIQGGLLATVMTRPTTAAVDGRPAHRVKARPGPTRVRLAENPLPVFYFMAAKLLAHTGLGFLLGALGSALQLTPKVQAVLQIGVGVFLLATALNMFNVHPILRYVVIQPPKRLTRLVRNQAQSEEAFAPIFLGLFTVFIPCGTTQAMELLAISSGHAWQGAAIMLVYVLGTAPTFLVLGMVASQLRGQLQRRLLTATAFLILGLSVVALDSGLKLLGSPLAPSYLVERLRGPGGTPVAAVIVDGVQELTIRAENFGYAPNYLSAQRGMPLRLRLVTHDSFACTRGFTIPALGLVRGLPQSGETIIDLPPQPPGHLRFTCSMGMYSGAIIIK